MSSGEQFREEYKELLEKAPAQGDTHCSRRYSRAVERIPNRWGKGHDLNIGDRYCATCPGIALMGEHCCEIKKCPMEPPKDKTHSWYILEK